MGSPITSTRWIRGSLTFCGRLARTLVTASLTSLSALSVLVSSANWIVVSDNPSVIDDEMCRTPSTPDTPSSMVFVTCDSSSAGAGPERGAAAENTGGGGRGAELRYRDRDHGDVGRRQPRHRELRETYPAEHQQDDRKDDGRKRVADRPCRDIESHQRTRVRSRSSAKLVLILSP